MPQNRQRYTPQPTKTDKAVVRGVGVFHMIFGTIFALVGLSVLPVVGLFALPFILAGGFFAVNGWRVATFKAGNLKKTMGAGDDPEDYPSALKFDPPVRPQRPAAPPRPAQTRREARPAVSQAARTVRAAAEKYSRDAAPEEETHDHIRSMARTPEGRLEQLKTLKDAGLYTEEEYRQKRAEDPQREVKGDMTMKLATALSRRKELQTHIHELEDRLMNNAQVQEGEEPAEDPRELLGELAADHQELERLDSPPSTAPTTARRRRGKRPSLICWPGGTVSGDSWGSGATSSAAPAPPSAAAPWEKIKDQERGAGKGLPEAGGYRGPKSCVSWRSVSRS